MTKKRIIYTQDDGTAAIIIPAPGVTITQLLTSVPEGYDYEIVDETDIPSDRTFRNAWEHDKSEEPQKIKHNMTKATKIAHDKRRAKRDLDFAPHDNIIAKQIPGQALKQTEAARQAIRDKDAVVQQDIDNASTIDELKAIVVREGM